MVLVGRVSLGREGLEVTSVWPPLLTGAFYTPSAWVGPTTQGVSLANV